jgi:adenylate cyclase
MTKKHSKLRQFFRKNLVVFMICAGLVTGTYWVLWEHYTNFRFNASTDLVYMMESRLLDIKLLVRGPQEPSERLGILAIDEESLNQFGRWPISRRYYRQAFMNLKKLGVRLIGFDAIFSEPEKTYLEDISSDINQLEMMARRPDPGLLQSKIRKFSRFMQESRADRLFLDGIRNFGQMIMGFFYFGSPAEADLNLGDRPRYRGLDQMLSSEVGYDAPEGFSLNDNNIIKDAYGIVPNTRFLSQGSEHFAFFNNDADPDAINRWVTLVANVNGHLMPSLSLKAAAEYLNREVYVFFDEIGVEGITLFNRDDPSIASEIPVDPIGAGRVLVNHKGPAHTFHHYSLADAYNNSFSEEQRRRLEGALLLLGATATGINDMRPNPFDPAIDGVENHAAVIDNILQNDFLKRPQSIYSVELAIVVAIGLLFTPVLAASTAIFSGISVVVFLVGYYYFDKYFWFAHGTWTYMAIPSIEIMSMYACTTLYKYMTEEKEKRQVKGAFQHYLSPEVIDQVLDDPSALSLGGQKKELTVFFSDVRSFTTISESLTPEKLCELMNEYFTPMTGIILRSQGVLDKYIGDAIMAFWGAPLDLPNSADTACEASIEMLYALDQLRTDFQKKGFPAIDIGIGLNTGQMSVGNMGSGERFTYTVMGDAVNLGSRLEGLTKEYGIKIMLSEYTQAKLSKGRFFTRDLDDIRVKGKNEPVRVFELMRPDAFPQTAKIHEFCECFGAGRLAYGGQNWEEATRCFTQCMQMRPDDKAAAMYLERIAAYQRESPGDDWDGVFTFTHK